MPSHSAIKRPQSTTASQAIIFKWWQLLNLGTNRPNHPSSSLPHHPTITFWNDHGRARFRWSHPANQSRWHLRFRRIRCQDANIAIPIIHDVWDTPIVRSKPVILRSTHRRLPSRFGASQDDLHQRVCRHAGTLFRVRQMCNRWWREYTSGQSERCTLYGFHVRAHQLRSHRTHWPTNSSKRSPVGRVHHAHQWFSPVHQNWSAIAAFRSFTHRGIVQWRHRLEQNTAPDRKRVQRRLWKQLDIGRFTEDLQRSKLVLDPPSDVSKLFDCYNDTLRRLINLHAPEVTVPLQKNWNKTSLRSLPKKLRYSSQLRFLPKKLIEILVQDLIEILARET